MILIDRDIKAALADRSIVIDPLDEACIGTNSVDVHLAPTLLTYTRRINGVKDVPLHCRYENPTEEHTIDPINGFTLEPGELYLGCTLEYTETLKHVPFLEGKSSLGRLGLSIHVTAGKGDVGFCGHWTMEMTVTRRLVVLAGMPIGQLIYHEVSSQPIVSYEHKPSQKYSARIQSTDPKPVASKMWMNFK